MTEDVKNEIALMPQVKFTPAKFDVVNLEELTLQVEAIIKAHEGEIVTEENEEVATEDRKKLDDFVEKLSRKRIDTEHELLTEFEPKKKALMALENKVKQASQNIKNQTDVFKKQRKAKLLAEWREKVQTIINAAAHENAIDPLRIVWSEEWNKSGVTQKSVKSDVDNQIAQIKNADQLMEANKKAIEMIGDVLNLDPKPYIEMLNDQSVEVVKHRMDKAAEDRAAILKADEERKKAEAEKAEKEKAENEQRLENERQAKLKQAQDIIANKKQEQHAIAPNPLNVEDKQVDAKPEHEFKTKYFKMEVDREHWQYVQAVFKMLNENGVKTQFVEPIKNTDKAQ